MAQAAAFDQAVEIFGEIGGVIASAFQGLRHQENFEARGIVGGGVFGQMLLEHGVADAVDVFVHLQNFAGAFEIELDKTAVNQIEHLAQDGRHFYELAHVGGSDLSGSRLHPHGDAHHQIADAFQIRGALQAGQQLPGAGLIDSRNGGGQVLVDVAFNDIEFLLAFFDGQKSHARRVGQEIADIESRVARDEERPESGARQIVERAAAFSN